MVKRGVDLLFSVVLLCLALPVLLLSALIIWISSPGPILFRQARMGRDFKTFEILKLRTMAHAEGGVAYTLGPDPRITPFGRWLRRSKIDELPQLWNVLRGEMSLVGPRPVLPELTAEFRFHYRLLLRARPGLTDPASLKYSQEAQLLAQARDPMRFFKHVVTPDKIRISLEYMENATVWSDLGTLAMTGLICCFPALNGMYGKLPDPLVAQSAPAPEPRQAIIIGSLRMPMDGCAFSHELANLEASLEAGHELELEAKLEPMPGLRAPDRAGASFGVDEIEPRGRESIAFSRRMPWNPLYLGRMDRQSTVSEVRERVTRL